MTEDTRRRLDATLRIIKHLEEQIALQQDAVRRMLSEKGT